MARAYPPSGPCRDCAADIMGPLPSGENLHVIVDYYSRYFEVVILRSTTSAKVIDSLKPIFAQFGVSNTLKAATVLSSFQRSSKPSLWKWDRTPNNSPSVAPGEWGGRTSKPHFVESDPDFLNDLMVMNCQRHNWTLLLVERLIAVPCLTFLRNWVWFLYLVFKFSLSFQFGDSIML